MLIYFTFVLQYSHLKCLHFFIYYWFIEVHVEVSHINETLFFSKNCSNCLDSQNCYG